MLDALVAGGGLAGLSSALALAERGARVALLEREVIGRHASTLNAGGVRRTHRHPAELPLAGAAFALWPVLSDRLGVDVRYRVTGHLQVAENEAELARLTARAAGVRALGFAHERMVDAAEARRLAPALAPHILGALYGEADGHADPHAVVAGYRDACEAAGVRMYEATALLGLTREGDSWRAATAAGAMRARWLVNCAGAWGAEVAAMAGDRLPVEPSAPMALLLPPLPRFVGPVIQCLTRRLSLKQLDDGRVMIGGGHRARLPRPGAPEVLLEEAATNLATARAILPGPMEAAEPARIWAGTDGYSQDGVAIIGASARVPGLLHACGLSGHGFAIGPAIGGVMADLAEGRTPAVDISGLDPGRFQGAGPVLAEAERNAG